MPLDRELIKQQFQNGDKPNEADFARIIDSTINFTDDNIAVVGGKIGIKTNDPKATLHVYDDGSDAVFTGIGGATLMVGNQIGKNISMDGNEITAKNGAAASRLSLQPDGGDVAMHYNGSTYTKLMFKDTGKVGIGTITPVGPLHINTASKDFVVDDNGQVGIGTTTPAAMLHVYHSNTDMTEEDNTSGAVIIGNTDGQHLSIDNNEIMAKLGNVAADLYLNREGGHVYVGSSSNQTTLTIYDLNNLSDKALKEKIKPLKVGRDAIMKLKPVSYVWKTGKDKTDIKYGFIAQDVEKVISDITYKDKSSNAMGIASLEMIPIVVKAMQEQQSHIEMLEARLAKLEKLMQKK